MGVFLSFRSSIGQSAASCDSGGPAVRTAWIVTSERLIFAIVIGVLCWTAWLWTHTRPISIFLEHGLLENAQVVILVACVIVLIPTMSFSRGVTHTISLMLMIAMVTGIVREAEVKSIPGPEWWRWLTHEFSLQEILLIVGALILLTYTWSRRGDLVAVVQRSLHPYAFPLQVGIVLLFVGAYATEKLIQQGAFSKIAEENLETAGYLLILVGILRTLDKALWERSVP